MFLGSDEDRMKAIQKLGTRANNQGGLSSLWMANRLFVCVTDPPCIEVVTRTCLEKDHFLIKILRTATGDGSIFGPVKIWHRRRKINSSFFNLKNLHRLLPMFNEKSLLMTKVMKAEAGGGHFSIWKYVTAFTFDAVGESAFGVSFNSQENQNQDMLHAITYCTQKVAGRTMQPWLHPDFIYHVLPVYKEFQKWLKHGYNFVEEIIKNKRTELAKIGPKEIKNINKNEPTNFIDIAMQNPGGLEKCYSDLELREEALVMLVAGNDTSATSSSFTSVLLSRYLEVQDKVHQELLEVFGDSDRPVAAEDLNKLKYLEAVLKESLRLYPPVPIVVREVNNDTVLPCNTTLVEGSSILLNIWATHRNPAYWGEDADVFRPERFLEGPLKHPAQFIPFSYSIRNCLGATYAMLSMKISLANMLRRYRLFPPTEIEAADLKKPLPVSFEIMMKAVDGWQLRVQEK